MKNRISRFQLGLLFGATVLLAGCATSTENFDTSKYSTPAPGKAGLFAVREAAWGLTQLKDVELYLDRKLIGKIGISEYLYADVEPGLHNIGPDPTGWREINVHFDAGQNYLFRLGRDSKMTPWVAIERIPVRIENYMGYIKRGDYEVYDLD
ncbi:DUF2846 domain-containing protein [Xenophilus sp. Marseille-Q4582]|uniref:DUF2846 domain-containing protein n=1 Tax=Xenophilus sp. Marseille-Q4582 TaxID=2866600 RepID=UPI001CE468B7|nr:DUF2846 domain-containing protein [Xenophilus sp. Marseille-Q4582]